MKKITKNTFRSVLSLVLVAAMVLMFAGCGQNNVDTSPENSTQQQEAVEKSFTFKVTDLDGTTTSFEIKTDATTVGEALVEKGLISGTQGDYGLMVDTVNGVKYDYNEDGAYWAFYENDAYAMSGVDTTVIAEGVIYSFVATKA